MTAGRLGRLPLLPAMRPSATLAWCGSGACLVSTDSIGVAASSGSGRLAHLLLLLLNRQRIWLLDAPPLALTLSAATVEHAAAL